MKTHAFALQITERPSQDPLQVPETIDIHLHLPAGAQKKDGPSAGVAMVILNFLFIVSLGLSISYQTCAFVSLLTGATVPVNVAMTGEVSHGGEAL